MGGRLSAEFKLAGIGFRITASRACRAILAEAERFWGYYASPAPQPAFLIDIESVPDWRPFALLRPHTPAAVFEEWTWHAAGGKQYFLHSAAAIVSRPGHIDAYLRDDQQYDARALVTFALNFVILEQLRAQRLFYVHAAGVQAPDDKRYLLSGDAGHGKSTMTTGLLASGFSYLSDDAVFLDARDGAGRILGYRKHFHLGADLRSRFAALTGMALEAAGKLEISPEQLFPGRELGAMQTADILLFPELSGRQTTRIQPMRRVEALTELFKTSTQVFLDRELAADHLAALRRLADGARSYRFQAGTDVYHHPELYAELVKDL